MKFCLFKITPSSNKPPCEFQTPLRYTKTLLLPVVLVVFAAIVRKVCLPLGALSHCKAFSSSCQEVSVLGYVLIQHNSY